MESPRITLARVLELEVPVTWREATAIVHEAVAQATGAEGSGPVTVTPASCLLTRGGDVILAEEATRASRETMVRVLDDLLAA